MSHGCLMILNGCVMTRLVQKQLRTSCTRMCAWSLSSDVKVWLYSRDDDLYLRFFASSSFDPVSHILHQPGFILGIFCALYEVLVWICQISRLQVCLIIVISGNLNKYSEYNSSCTFNTNDESSCSLLRRGGLCHKLPTTLPTHISVPWHPPRTPQHSHYSSNVLYWCFFVQAEGGVMTCDV